MSKGQDPHIRPDGTPRTRPTPREIKALRAMAEGNAPIREVAQLMGVPVGTLSNTLSALYKRLGIDRRAVHYTEARRIAIEMGKREGWWPDA